MLKKIKTMLKLTLASEEANVGFIPRERRSERCDHELQMRGSGRKRYFSLNEKGMTLIEIMVVVTILGIIATIVTVNVLGRLDQAKVSAAKTQIKNLETALDEFRRDNGYYPSTEQGLKALVEKPSTGRVPTSYPRGGYLKGGQIPKDPWGCEFNYISPGIHGNPYEMTSLGADCQEGGEDVDEDINSWEIGATREKQ
jgi:general secretion pathway protein G